MSGHLGRWHPRWYCHCWQFGAGGLLIAVVSACAAGQPASTGTTPPGATLRVGLIEWQIITSSNAVTPGAATGRHRGA